MDGFSWSDLTITPDDEAIRALRSGWRWRLGDEWSPLLFSIWGDVFLRKDGRVCWLNTGTGEVSDVAPDEDAFRRLLDDGGVETWFLPGLLSELHASGKRPRDGECFTYAIYPVFAEGKYEAWNFAPVPAREHFAVSGALHQQVAELPDGESVEVRIVD